VQRRKKKLNKNEKIEHWVMRSKTMLAGHFTCSYKG